MKQNISHKITVFAFIMSLIIVFYHCDCFLPVLRESDEHLLRYFNFFSEIICTFSLGYFFISSGFLLYNGVGTTSDMYRKMKKRLYSLGVPFLLWNIIIICMNLIVRRALPFGSLREFIEGFTVTPFNGPLWYMAQLLFMMLPAPLIIKLKGHRVITSALLFALAAFGIAVSTYHQFPVLLDNEYGSQIWRFFRYLPHYCIGVFGGLYFSDTILNEKYNRKTVCIVSTAALIGIFVYLLFANFHARYVWLLVLLAPVLLWFSVDSRIFSRPPSFPVRSSFFIYSLHQPIIGSVVIPVIIPLLEKSGPYSMFTVIMIQLSAVVMLSVISVFSAFLSKKLLPAPIFAALSGGRVSKESR